MFVWCVCVTFHSITHCHRGHTHIRNHKLHKPPEIHYGINEAITSKSKLTESIIISWRKPIKLEINRLISFALCVYKGLLPRRQRTNEKKHKRFAIIRFGCSLLHILWIQICCWCCFFFASVIICNSPKIKYMKRSQTTVHHDFCLLNWHSFTMKEKQHSGKEDRFLFLYK